VTTFHRRVLVAATVGALAGALASHAATRLLSEPTVALAADRSDTAALRREVATWRARALAAEAKIPRIR